MGLIESFIKLDQQDPKIIEIVQKLITDIKRFLKEQRKRNKKKLWKK